MLNEAEKAQLGLYRGMGSMNQAQAVEYHELLVKEAVKPVVVEVVVEPKKRGKK